MERRRKYYITKERRVLNVVQFITLYSTVVLLIAAGLIVACAMTSCSLIDEDTAGCPATETAGTPGSAIAFDTEGTVLSVHSGDSTARTRTAPGTMTLDGTGGTESLKAKGFGVFACHTGLHPYVSTSQTQDFMYNQLVSYNTSNTVWDYSPVAYWPSTVDGLYPYVTFFAYAPYAANPGSGSSAAEQCIVDCMLPVESGDPWLVYQLGGSEEADGSDGWKASQVDLLYDFRPDCQQGATPERIEFGFRHALACAGDDITVTCSTDLQDRLKSLYGSSPVTLTLQRVSLTYNLLRKGRLYLASTTSPRWETIASESPVVTRRLTFEPNQVIAMASSATTCTLTDYSESNQGIFYIPIADAGNPQWVEITVDYSTNQGTTGTLTTRVNNLNTIAAANENRDFNIVLPDTEFKEIPGDGFTVNSSGTKVAFSPGNLQATYDGSDWTWKFAEHQWDYIGSAAANTSINGNGTVSSNGTVDLFGWVGNSSTWEGVAQYGISNSTATNSTSGYGNVATENLKSDWGATIGTGWRTLSQDEWDYLFNTRTYAADKYGYATVADKHGIIILPDAFTDPNKNNGSGAFKGSSTTGWEANTYTAENWTAMESAGAVFLPAAGYRLGTSVNDAGAFGYYWSSTAYGEGNAYYVDFNSDYLNADDYGDRYFGQSVRLVRQVE